MIKIDNEKLCDYCEKKYEIDRDRCEGSKCESAYDSYLDDFGIENDYKKTFWDLKIKDNIYLLINGAIPSIAKKIISGLSVDNYSKFYLQYESESIHIPDKSLREYGHIFISRHDAEQELERICVERIVELSKIIGAIKK